jgi:hypothetical protein
MTLLYSHCHPFHIPSSAQAPQALIISEFCAGGTIFAYPAEFVVEAAADVAGCWLQTSDNIT